MSRTAPWWMYLAPVYDVREINVVVLPILFVTSYMVSVSVKFKLHVSGQLHCEMIRWGGCKPTLVVSVADITALVTRVGAAVDKALRIVHVAITSGTPRGGGVRRISHVDEDESSAAGQVVPVPHGLVAADRPSSNGIPELLVHDDVVRPPDGQLVKVPREVLLREDGRAVRVEVEQLLHVEDLHAVLDGLGADDYQVAEGPDLPPPRADGVVLREPAEVDQLAL